MRNLAENWPRMPAQESFSFDRQGLAVTTITGLTQHLVSGNLGAFGEGLGALGVADQEATALRVARDRLLVVNGDAALLAPGWHAEGYAVTDVSAMYHVYEIEGSGIAALLAEAITIDPANPGPSAAIVFAGLPAVLYCAGDRQRLRLHVERGYATHIISWLEARV